MIYYEIETLVHAKWTKDGKSGVCNLAEQTVKAKTFSWICHIYVTQIEEKETTKAQRARRDNAAQ
jgi:23S rRNA maturation mini-RNase III